MTAVNSGKFWEDPDWVPATEQIKDICTFQRNRLGEPRSITPDQFDRWIDSVWQEGYKAGGNGKR